MVLEIIVENSKTKQNKTKQKNPNTISLLFVRKIEGILEVKIQRKKKFVAAVTLVWVKNTMAMK